MERINEYTARPRVMSVIQPDEEWYFIDPDTALLGEAVFDQIWPSWPRRIQSSYPIEPREIETALQEGQSWS